MNEATDREIMSEVRITHSPGVVFEQPLNDAFLGVFFPPPQSLSLCPVESFMISGMFPMMPHLSVLL